MYRFDELPVENVTVTLTHCDSNRPEMPQCVRVAAAVAAAATLEEKSWKCISEVDASLALELYGDKNIFVPVEVEARVGGAGCAWMKQGCEIFSDRLRVSGPFAGL